jgi:hypothetical protein
MLDALFTRLLEVAERIRREERGDSLVNWVVVAVGLAAAGAALVTLLKPAIQEGGQKIVNLIAGSG